MSRKNEWNKLILCVLIQIHESYYKSLWEVGVKIGPGHWGLGTLKSAVWLGPIDEMSWFFVHWYKYRKGKSCFNNY